MAVSDPSDQVRQVIREAGLQTPLDEDDVREIASQSSNETPSTLGSAEVNLPSGASTGSSTSSSRDELQAAAARRETRRSLRSALRKTPQRDGNRNRDPGMDGGSASGAESSMDLSLPSSVIKDLQTPPRHGRSSHHRRDSGRAGEGTHTDHHHSTAGWSAPTPRIDDSDAFAESSFTFGASPAHHAGGRGASAGQHAALQGRLQAMEQTSSRLQDRVDELEDALHGESLRATQLDARAARAAAGERQAREEARAARASAEEQTLQLRRELEHLRAGASEAELEAADLELSEAAAGRLRSKDRGSLSLRERMALRLKEATGPLSEQLEQVRRELDQAREALGGQAHAAGRSQREAERRARTAEAAAEDATGRANDAEERAERLRERVRSLEQRCDQLQGKGDAFDAAEAERISLQRRTDEMAAALGAAEASVADLQDQRERLRSEIGDLRAKDEALAAERTRWQRSAEDTGRDLRRERARVLELEAKLGQAEAGREQARESLQRERDERAVGESSRLEQELQRLREEAAVEMAKVRNDAEELRAREQAHSDRRLEDQAASIRSLQERLDASESSRRQVAQQLEGEARATGEALAKANSEVRVKAFELERTVAQLGEAQEGRRAAEERVEILRKQVDVARTEIQRVGSSTEQERAELRASLEHERAKVRAYQALEAELDATVLAAGRAAAGLIEGGGDDEQGGGKGAASSGHSESKSPERPGIESSDQTLLGGLPAGAQRRVRQGVRLAHLLVVRTREVHELQAQLRASRSTSEELRSAMVGMEADIAKASEPQGYVVKALRSKEDAIRRAREDAEAAREALAAVQTRCKALEDSRDGLQRELGRVLASRSEIHSLRDAIQQAIQASAPVVGARAAVAALPSPISASRSSPQKAPVRLMAPSPSSSDGGSRGSGKGAAIASRATSRTGGGKESEPSSPLEATAAANSRPVRRLGVTSARDPSPPSSAQRPAAPASDAVPLQGGVALFPTLSDPNDDAPAGVGAGDEMEVRFLRVVTDEGGAPLPPWYVKERLVGATEQV